MYLWWIPEAEPAINDIIDHIKPQGTVMLMGVGGDHWSQSTTRDVLEKGLTFVGSSRSGRVKISTGL